MTYRILFLFWHDALDARVIAHRFTVSDKKKKMLSDHTSLLKYNRKWLFDETNVLNFDDITIVTMVFMSTRRTDYTYHAK